MAKRKKRKLSTKGAIIQLVQRKGKRTSDRGLFVSVKWPEQRIKYYRYEQGMPLDAYGIHSGAELRDVRKAYRQEKGARSTKSWRRHKRYIKKLETKGRVSTLFKRGVVGSAQFDPWKLNTAKMKDIYRQIFGPVILDKELLENNLDLVMNNTIKMKHRFFFTTRITGRTPEGGHDTVATISDEGKRNLQDYQRDYLRNMHFQPIKYGTVIERQGSTESLWIDETSKVLKIPRNWIKVLKDKSTITGVRTHMYFVQGTGNIRGGSHVT